LYPTLQVHLTRSYAQLLHCTLYVVHLESNFIIVLWAAFMCADPETAKDTVKLSVFLRFQDLHL